MGAEALQILLPRATTAGPITPPKSEMDAHRSESALQAIVGSLAMHGAFSAAMGPATVGPPIARSARMEPMRPAA